MPVKKIDLGRGNSMTMSDTVEESVAACPGPQVICRPLKANVPIGREGWGLTACPKCGVDCWKTTNEPDPLPANWTAACTECALRQSNRFSRP